ncbi:thiol-disulfide isomerase/thioredoxin [Paenibacillus shirakamiensis]|uniref:Thiol-disulfide isomerase/thioredoxin n=1 Tax=Paenibacillus shirakamiensis TaxID=1265935 RepID=A0ABS4JHT1_9BACL|nr:TlpA disulfide reductase family protein [Paenibacillus shirakamiensis]MBP2001275.1 thiol-disulfide isomerase/thioredoxin [Paenibacillus shirakamiensis]
MKRMGLILSVVALLLAIALYQNSDKGIMSWWDQWMSKPSSLGATASANSGLKIGSDAPSFSLQALNGQTYSIGGSRDKPMLLNFWASWCGPCQEEAPDLVRLSDKYKQNLDVYSVNVTMYDKLKDAKEFVDKYKYTFPVLLDEKAEAYQQYNGVAFPTNILIDRHGKIQDVIIGTLTAKDLEFKLMKLVDSK